MAIERINGVSGGGAIVTVSCPFCDTDNSEFEQGAFSHHLLVCPDAPREPADD